MLYEYFSLSKCPAAIELTSCCLPHVQGKQKASEATDYASEKAGQAKEATKDTAEQAKLLTPLVLL